jgi:hypothetical protein
MAFTDTFNAMPEQFLEMLGVAQQMVLTSASAVAASARALTPALPAVPFADRMPDPAKLADDIFAFSEKVLASQRDFSSKLLEAYQATKAPAAAKVSAAKSA